METTAATRDARSGAAQVAFSQRTRLVEAAAWVCAERGSQRITVAQIIATAGVSRTTFYREFADCEDCLAEALLSAGSFAGERAGRAFAAEREWRAALRAGLAELLRFFDEQTPFASLCLAETLILGPAASEVLERFTVALEKVLSQGAADGGGPPSGVTPRGLVGGAWWILHARQRDPQSGPLLDLLNPLMAFLVEPYAGPDAAKRELLRPPPAAAPRRPRHELQHPMKAPRLRMTHRTMRVVDAIGRRPGMSNREVLACSGISDQGQASKLLHRLQRAGLLVNRGAGQQRGEANAWYLTAKGRDVEARLKRLAMISP